MRAVRLLDRGGPSGVVVEDIDRPVAAPGEALVRVRAAAITRDELDWPVMTGGKRGKMVIHVGGE
jgi:NADPH:quinone reductase-like Zn-dependent oxidoreductase